MGDDHSLTNCQSRIRRIARRPQRAAARNRRVSAGIWLRVLLSCGIASLLTLTQPAIAAHSAQDIADAQFQIYFTADAPEGIPSDKAATQFACTDKIFLILEAQGLVEANDYQLAVTWTDPKGKEREQTRYTFSTFGDQTRLWAWLRMNRGAGNTLLSIVDGAAGLKEFIGDWRVKVYIDGRQVGDSGFSVIC